MDERKLKYELLFKPFILFNLSFILFYTLLNWFFFIKLELFEVRDDIVGLWLPLILSFIASFLFLRKRIKILDLEDTKDLRNFDTIFFMLAFIALLAPTLIAQSYIKTASAELSTLNSCMQIDSKNLCKYYKFDSLDFNKKLASVFWEREVSGKHSENMNFYGYFALPVLSKEADSSATNFNIWLGIEYSIIVDNELPRDSIHKLFEEFKEKYIQEFELQNFKAIDIFERIGNSNKKFGIAKAININPCSNKSAKPVILSAFEESYESRNGDKLNWIIATFLIFTFFWRLLINVRPINKKGLENYLNPSLNKEDVSDTTEKDPNFTLINYIRPREYFFITHIIIGINIIVYFLMSFYSSNIIFIDNAILIKFGANSNNFYLDGQFWRYFTSLFVHPNIYILLLNIYGLLFVGEFLEKFIYKRKFTIVFVICGIIANIASVKYGIAPINLGMAGAIFGLFAIYLAIRISDLLPRFLFQPYFENSYVYIYIMAFLSYVLNGHYGFDFISIFSGFFAGLVISPIVYLFLKSEKRQTFEK